MTAFHRRLRETFDPADMSTRVGLPGRQITGAVFS